MAHSRRAGRDPVPEPQAGREGGRRRASGGGRGLAARAGPSLDRRRRQQAPLPVLLRSVRASLREDHPPAAALRDGRIRAVRERGAVRMAGLRGAGSGETGVRL